MDDFFKMDVFFIVSTIAVVIVTALIAFILVSVLRILRHVEDLSATVSEEAKLVRADVADLRASVRSEGLKARHIGRFAKIFTSLFSDRKSK